MEILITETTTSENITGFNVTFINLNKKKKINDADYFPDGSEVDVKIKQLKKLLKQYFDAQV
jgi:vacuolar-type H+-ATPase subunit D/Vma8